MNRLLACLLCLAGFLILLQFLVFMVISEWLVDDSYAVIQFPKAHPRIAILVELVDEAGKLGGRYVLLLLVLILSWCLIRLFRKRNAAEVSKFVPGALAAV